MLLANGYKTQNSRDRQNEEPTSCIWNSQVIHLNDYVIVILALILISALLPFLQKSLVDRSNRIRTSCLLVANDNDWISIEEIASITGVSTKKARQFVLQGVEKRIILGQVENDVFIRSRYRDPNEIFLEWPDDID
jgi:hypothetical protein